MTGRKSYKSKGESKNGYGNGEGDRQYGRYTKGDRNCIIHEE